MIKRRRNNPLVNDRIADALVWLSSLVLSLREQYLDVSVLHCDLKPANILVFPMTEVAQAINLKLSDFGCAFLQRRPRTRKNKNDC